MDLPVAVKWGNLYEIDQYVYFVGGVQTERGREIPTAVYRFSFQNSSWNLYDIRNEVGKSKLALDNLMLTGSF